MGRLDKDRHQKELAVRFCLANGSLPFVEVKVLSAADLSESAELVTDLDVLGVQPLGDGPLRRTLFDCKTSSKLSPVNRAFWAAGLMQYVQCDYAFVILGSRAVHNHRMTGLALSVDIQDERSFVSLGQTLDAAFPADLCYQSSLARWEQLHDGYAKCIWANNLLDLAKNVAPLTRVPWGTFRRVLAELRTVQGYVDPSNPHHLSIFLDVLSAVFLLWTAMSRDLRRLYEPSMDRAAFEKLLRYYLWGGKESYTIRQEMRKRADPSGAENASVELPEWDALVSYAGIALAAPHNMFDCAVVARELAIRVSTVPNESFDKRLAAIAQRNDRVRQFFVSLSDYLVRAGKLPSELGRVVQQVVFELR